jgi:Tol biopolymer transport system component
LQKKPPVLQLKYGIILCFLFFPALVFSQKSGVPKTAIYLLRVNRSGSGFTFSHATLVTPDSGYNNQPYFSPNSLLLYYVSNKKDSQTNVYNYQINDHVSNKIFRRQGLKEYSPQLMPDGKHISVVQVQRDDSSQYLVSFPMFKDTQKIIFPKINPVGYYSWINDSTAALFVLGKTLTLQLANLRTKRTHSIADNIGRCIQKVPSLPAVSYVDESDTNHFYIKYYNLSTNKRTTVTECLKGSEDYCWTKHGDLLMGQDGKLFIFDPLKDKTWRQIADFSREPYGKFYRLTMSPDGSYLALVSYVGKKP